MSTAMSPTLGRTPRPMALRFRPRAERRRVLDVLAEGRAAVQCLQARFARICADRRVSPALRAGLARRLCGRIAANLHVVDELLHPTLRELVDDPRLVDRAELEHERLREMMDRLGEIDADEPSFDDRVRVIGERFDAQLRREADVLAPIVPALPLDVDELGWQMTRRRDDLIAEMSRGHGLRFENEAADPVGAPPR